MPTVSTKFTLPCSGDRAVIAVQDIADQHQWNVISLSSTEIVMTKVPMYASVGQRLKLTANLHETSEGETQVLATSSAMTGAFFDGKKRVTEMLGTFVNSLPLRVQTEPIAINPTVAVGEGQRETSQMSNDRLDRLMKLKQLLDSGALSEEEFQMEKARILGT